MEKGTLVDLIAEIIRRNSGLSYGKCVDTAEAVADALNEDGWLLIHNWHRQHVGAENLYTGRVWEG